MQLLRFAWRNVWRNGRRSAINLTAIAVGTAILMLIGGLMQGMMSRTVSSSTQLSMGEAAAHHPDFLRTRSLYDTLEDGAALTSKADELGVGYAARSFGYGLIAAGTKSSGTTIWGIHPEQESNNFTFASRVVDGEFVGTQPNQRAVIGGKLARTLRVGVGDELIALVQATDGSMGNEIYVVGGILGTITEEIDRTGVFLHRDDFDMLFVADGMTHEIAFSSAGRLDADSLAGELQAVAKADEVKSWRKLVPMLAEMVTLSKSYIWILGVVFFFAAGIGVLNTMLMATYERIGEFGLAKALGASPWHIVRELTVEAALTGVIGTVFGVVAASPLAWYLAVSGIDMMKAMQGESLELNGIPMGGLVYFEASARVVLVPMLVMFITCMAASLYPAITSSRIRPLEAMKHV